MCLVSVTRGMTKNKKTRKPRKKKGLRKKRIRKAKKNPWTALVRQRAINSIKDKVHTLSKRKKDRNQAEKWATMVETIIFQNCNSKMGDESVNDNYARSVRSILSRIDKKGIGETKEFVTCVKSSEPSRTTLFHKSDSFDERSAKVLAAATKDRKEARLAVMSEKSLLQCRSCKKFKVTFYERQTRGADEPMTVFARCMACGHAWKQ